MDRPLPAKTVGECSVSELLAELAARSETFIAGYLFRPDGPQSPLETRTFMAGNRCAGWGLALLIAEGQKERLTRAGRPEDSDE